jgi:hypothetical protein
VTVSARLWPPSATAVVSQAWLAEAPEATWAPSSVSVYVYGVVPPLAAIPTVTVPLTVAPSAGLVNDAARGGGGGGGPLAIVIGIEVAPVLPVASRALAVSVCGPSGALAVLHGMETGPVEAVVWVATVWPATESV